MEAPFKELSRRLDKMIEPGSGDRDSSVLRIPDLGLLRRLPAYQRSFSANWIRRA
jgi:hypothetical protein